MRRRAGDPVERAPRSRARRPAYAVVVAGGPDGPAWWPSLVDRADLVICADGGVDAARARGRVPHLVIGDFDSASSGALAWARRRGARLVRYPRDKDATDTELALAHALAAGARRVDILGALDGRVDHALANVGLLLVAARRRCRARLVRERTEVFLARGATPIPGRAGDLVSLLPLFGPASGITTRGLRYGLRGGRLSAGSTRGVSNVVVRPPAGVTVRRGRLLVVVTHRRRPADAGRASAGSRV
ncbi:MAG: thiamine diphosphokinase [Armatimonadota bacterium]|nr:thiamine diphosphokinase [Armatimonadota bacterium]MDR7403620.1 thiamine diphosphokinase [Armatimonadota bacterium]